MNTPDLPLAGCGIAITRPPGQAQELAQLIRDAGGEPILFPLLEVAALDDYGVFDRLMGALDSFDWAIFISSNAVQYGMARLLSTRSLPLALRYAAIGPSTAATLAHFGIHGALTPGSRFDSESLLNLPEMQAVAGKRCMIFRGVGGRDLLAQTLRERGAEVEFAECYRRTNPSSDAGELMRLWQKGRLQAIVVTSSEALRNLLGLAGDTAGWLKTTPLFVNHPRIAEAAAAQGLQAVAAQSPGDAGMLAALLDWQNNTSK